jgi:hypothetical protein
MNPRNFSSTNSSFGSTSNSNSSSSSNSNNQIFKSTTNSQLDEMMKAVKGYRGAHSKDWCNDKTPKQEEYLILNLEDSGQGGSHWVAVCNKSDNKYIEYFDSFGMPIPDTILDYMQRSRKKIINTTDDIQTMTSNACGYYCVDYLESRYLGSDICDIMGRFKDGFDNDPELKIDLEKNSNNIKFSQISTKKLLDNKNMVQMNVYNADGGHYTSVDLDANKAQIKRILRNLPSGNHTVHVKLDDADPVSVSYDPSEVGLLKNDSEIQGTGLGDILKALPHVINIAAPLIKAGVDAYGAYKKSPLSKSKGSGLNNGLSSADYNVPSQINPDNVSKEFGGMNLTSTLGSGLGRNKLRLRDKKYNFANDDCDDDDSGLSAKIISDISRKKNKLGLTDSQLQKINSIILSACI